jgi:hypothetical protein
LLCAFIYLFHLLQIPHFSLRIAPVNNKGDDDISAIVFTVGDNYTTEKNTKDYQGTLDIWSAVMRGESGRRRCTQKITGLLYM